LSVNELADLAIEAFGGRCTSMPPADLPAGASALNQDVEFPEGAVRTRAGLQAVYAALPGLPNVNGLKTYQTPSFLNRLLAWDALGNMYRYDSAGTRTNVSLDNIPGLRLHSTTVFGREYQAFYDGNTGADIPRQYDDTNFDRVSQVGPGQSPSVANFLPDSVVVQGAGAGAALTVAAAPNGAITTDLETYYMPDPPYLPPYIPPPPPETYYTTATYTTTAAHGLAIGDQVDIAGVADGFFNVTGAIVTAIPTPTTFKISIFSYVLRQSGAGTVTPKGPSLTRVDNVVTAVTAAAHNFVPGWFVEIGGYAALAVGGAATATAQDGVVTVTTAAAHGLTTGTLIITAGFGDDTFNTPAGVVVQTVPSATTFTYNQVTASSNSAGGTVSVAWNGKYQIVTTPTATSFTYSQIGPNSLSGAAGTATIKGSITAGLHGVSVAFITRQGYITKPSPPVYFYAAGEQLAALTNIAVGPANVVSRLLMFTSYIAPPATTGVFYSILKSMTVNNNTVTSMIFDFSDSDLIASYDASNLFGQEELGECTSVGAYNSRLVWLGERAKVPNFINLTFDGGWNLGGGMAGSDEPLGWISDVTDGTGGSRSTAGAWMDGYKITGNGAAALRGMITQSAYQDYLNVQILRPNVGYSYRVRLKRSGLTQGNFTIEIYSATLGSLGLANVAFSAMSTATFTEFSGVLMAAQTTIPYDAILRVYGSGIMTNLGYFIADSIEIFPTLSPVNASNARLSYVNNPESYDGVTGNIGIRPNDGQTLRGQFPIRSNYYFGKDNYLCYVTDDGTNEPSSWAVNEVSATIGICGPNAVDWTEEWAVFAHRTGFYLCLGSDPIKINQEIMDDASGTGQICWNSINWLYGHTVWVRINAKNKLILVGAPVNGATSPNVVFVMDYKFAPTPDHIAGGPGVGYSSSGKIGSHGGARKWTIWNITAPCAAFIEQTNGTTQDFYGNGVGNGLIYNRPAGQFLDDGVAINSFWETPAMPSNEQEQSLQMRGHRKLFGYLTGRVTGTAALPGAVVTMTQTGPGYVQVVMSLPHGLAVNDWVIVSGASDTTYNGYQRVIGTPNPTTFIYQAVTTLPAAAGATVLGTLNVDIITTARTTRIRGVRLGASPVGDFERQTNVHSERAIYHFGTTIPGGNFQLERVLVSMQPDPTMLIRGAGL
jgi:hypothetical protein